MVDLISDTPAARVPCEVDNCDKDYASKGNMMAHVKKHHKVVDQIDSPLGSFPLAISARVLFAGETGSSVQGNSAGQVTSPAVNNAPRYIYGKCEKDFETKAELDELMVKRKITTSLCKQ